MTAEVLDIELDDAETIFVTHIKPMYPAVDFPVNRVSNIRRLGDPLPFVLVTHIDGTECEEESTVDELVSVHVFYPKNNGDAAAIRAFRDGATEVHKRVLLLARYLIDVPLPSGRNADIEYVDVAMRPRTEDYGDDQILRKVSRYRLGLSYAKLS